MRQLLFVTLLLLSLAYGGIAGITNDLPGAGDDLLRTYIPYRRDADANVWEPIRIAVNFGGVLESVRRCNEGSKRGRSNVGGEICGEIGQSGVAKALEYSRKVVPAAVMMHADRLLVRRVGDILRVETGEFTKSACKSISLNPDDQIKGIQNADVVLFVGLTASSSPVTEICKTDKHGRPTVAVIQLRPQDILGTEERYIRLFAHEIAHAIGFDSIETKKYGESNEGTIEHYQIEKAKISKMLQEVLGCRNNVGVIKMVRAKEGGNRLHFPKSLVRVELMNAYEGDDFGTASMIYSPLTLAVFESTGLYKVDFDAARDSMEWYRTPLVECGELRA